jgi:hypothetical protein
MAAVEKRVGKQEISFFVRWRSIPHLSDRLLQLGAAVAKWVRFFSTRQ